MVCFIVAMQGSRGDVRYVVLQQREAVGNPAAISPGE